MGTPVSWKFYLGLFLFCVVLFGYIHWTEGFVDPDAFYHAKLAELIAERRGPVIEFPWLPLTSFSDNFIDHQFLYHVLLVPFVTLAPPLVGIKAATVLFASLFVVFFTWLLLWRLRASTIHVPAPILALFILLFLTCSPFIFRLTLAKTTALSLLFFFACLYAILARRMLLLGILSFFYVWLYGGWPLVLVASGVAWIAHSILERRISVKGFFIPLSASVGCLAGLVLNPYFPKNLTFYVLQTIQFPFSSTAASVGVGGEWYPMGLAFAPVNAILLSGCVMAVVVLVLRRRVAFDELLTGILAFLFALLAIKSQRHIEYFAPMAFFFAGLVLLREAPRAPILFESLRSLASRAIHRSFAAHMAVAYLLVSFAFLVGIGSYGIISLPRQVPFFGFRVFDGARDWLSKNTPQGSLVFHDRWDDFPLLFFSSPHNAYVSGLDPRFLCAKDEKLCVRYEQLTDGTVQRGIAEAAKKEFGSRVIVVRNTSGAFLEKLRREKVREVYTDRTVAIFQIN